MFEAPPEKPSHFAGRWIALVALVGGVAGVVVAALVLGEESVQSDMVLFGSFLVGAGLGAVAGWKLVMPQPPPPSS